MKQEYVITYEELQQRGLNLSDYALDGTVIPAIIQIGLDIAVTRCCYLFDNIGSEDELEKALDSHQDKVSPFKKLQYRIIYNLIFKAETEPYDTYIDTIISHEINLGKINGYQKGLFQRYN